ncbi:MAG: NAD-binding protein [Clostridiaceae bacterium]|nr:NAD-binding protein [Clostridiaceae bacterium]
MNILVIGNDLRTQLLTKSLLNAKHHVTLVSNSLSFCTLIANQTDQTTVLGDASQPYTLASAGADHCDLLIAMSEKDADNLVICDLAKKKFGVPRTIATVENPINCTVFQRLGVDSVICAAEACSHSVENAITAIH